MGVCPITAQSDYTHEKAIIDPILRGRLVESSVGTHLLNHSVSERYNLYYWREGKHEVCMGGISHTVWNIS